MAQRVKASACNAGDLGSIPGLGRSPGEGRFFDSLALISTGPGILQSSETSLQHHPGNLFPFSLVGLFLGPTSCCCYERLSVVYAVVVQSLSCAHSLETPYCPPGYMGFSRQEYWSGLPSPSPVDLPDAGIKLTSASPALAGRFITTEPPGKAPYYSRLMH